MGGDISQRTKRDAPELSLLGRRASDAIAGGVSARIMVTRDQAVKRTTGLGA